MKLWPFRRKAKAAGAMAPALVSRGFQAAQTDRLLSGWTFDHGWTAHELSGQLATMRARSREMSKNSAQFKRWLSLLSINVIGEGFALKSTPHDGDLLTPKSYKIDEAAARYIEWHWWRFCNYRDPVTGLTWFDASGRKTEPEMDRLNVKVWARDGEFFQQPLGTASNPYGITFRNIRPDAVDERYNEIKSDNVVVRCGVEVDSATLRPLAYYSTRIKPGHQITSPWAVGERLRIPASQLIHCFAAEDEDQPRGVPWAHAGLVSLKMLAEFDRAELTAAREEACTVGTYEANTQAADASQFADLTKEENKAAANSLMMEKEPGQQEIIPYGYKYSLHTPQHPNREAVPYKASVMKDVASAFGVEYSNFANDWAGVSFSSVRVGTISERDGYIVLQNDFRAQCKARQFLLWLYSFLSQPWNKLTLAKFDKFAEHEFRGRRWMWVDPMKDMAAAVVAVDRKWKTNTQVASDMGTDFDENVEAAKIESEKMAGDSKEAVPALNGAQIAAALQITTSYANGEIGKEAAIALLTAAGVPQEAAVNMIAKQQVQEPDDEDASQ